MRACRTIKVICEGAFLHLWKKINTPLALVRFKMAFFKYAWHRLKMLPHLNRFKSKEPLIRAFKWGILWDYTSTGLGDTEGQSWNFQKSPFLLSKFRSFNFDLSYLQNQWGINSYNTSFESPNQRHLGLINIKVRQHFYSVPRPFEKRPFYTIQGSRVPEWSLFSNCIFLELLER